MTSHHARAITPHAAKSHERSAHNLMILTLVVLAALVGLGLLGGVAYQRASRNERVVEMMGPKPNLASLPEIKVTLDGTRTLDLKVSVELAPGTKKRFSERALDHINDRIQEQVSLLDPDRLTGANSGSLIKRTVASAVNHETGPDTVKGVVIERMLVYQGSANIPLSVPEPTEPQLGMPFAPPKR